MIRLLVSYYIGDPSKLFCKTTFNDCYFRFKIDLRSQKGKREILFIKEVSKKWNYVRQFKSDFQQLFAKSLPQGQSL